MNPVTSDDANTYSYKTPPSSPKVPHVLDPKVLGKDYTYSFSRVSASFNGTFFFRTLDDYEDLSTTSEEELMRIHDDQTDDRVVFVENLAIGDYFFKGQQLVPVFMLKPSRSDDAWSIYVYKVMSVFFICHILTTYDFIYSI